MKIQQSSTPYLLLLAVLIIGLPLIEYQLEKQESAEAMEVTVQAAKPNYAEATNQLSPKTTEEQQ